MDLTNENLLLYPMAPRPSFIDYVLELFEARNLKANYFTEIRELHMALGLVAAGEGLTIVPKTLEHLRSQEVVYIPFEDSLLTSSIGAGKGGDIQFLFAEDILGNNGPPYPRHSKQYRELYKMKREMQLERIAGFKEFIEEVKNGNFPLEEHVIKAPSGLIESFVEKIKNTK